jgi:hypothetical protein
MNLTSSESKVVDLYCEWNRFIQKCIAEVSINI